MDLRERLAKLAAQRLYIGTSSWKYPGWLGDIYTPERYFTRGKLSRTKFNDNCLSEYAETFHTVGGDFSFYTFPKPGFWAKLFAQTPRSFQFGLKVPEMITVKRWPSHARYGQHKGLENESYLDPRLFTDAFLAAIEPYQAQVGPVMFEFGTFSRQDYAEPVLFFADLDRFLAALPKGWRYAVEIRNREYLGEDYFSVLRAHNVAHVFNAWTRMPPLEVQTAIDGAITADFIVCRALLRTGRTYEQAVTAFEPYDRIRDPNPEGRQAIFNLMTRGFRGGEVRYFFVNNRFEGNAPDTIRALLE